MRSLLLLLALATPALAQKKKLTFADVADVSATIEPQRAQPGDTVTFKLTITPKQNFWTYPTGKNVFGLPKTGDVVFDPKFADPPNPETKTDEMGLPEDYYPAGGTWEFKGRVSPTATPGKKTVALTGTKLQVCDKQNCYYSSAATTPTAEIEVLAGAAPPPPSAMPPRGLPPESANSQPQAVPLGPPKVEPPAPAHKGVIKKNAVPVAQHKAALDDLAARIEKESTAGHLPTTNLWGFLATAAVWGWISLVTPCVFPMIPITVSLFLKQGNKSTKDVLKLATVYSLTIILVIGLSAVAFLKTFRELSTNPVMNIGLGVLLVVFALSLFGMFDIALPGFLLRYTEKKRGAGGMIGTVFGALAFSIVSFTCVAPFLGGFAGMAASGQFSTLQLVLGGLVFATAFASPFFVLAMFPSLLKKLPKSGGWLDTIKAVMGFLEVAAALKFFRTAELLLLPRTEYFTYEVCLAGLIVTSGVCGLYLLNVFRLPHDEERPNIGVGRLMWALAFLGLAVYLAPGLFKTSEGKAQRPRGVVYAWVDAFLLPDASPDLPWNSDLPAAVAQARKETGQKRFVFVDFTGESCQNCKYNENNVFPRPEIDPVLRGYTLAAMYTDKVPTDFYHTPPAEDASRAEAAENAEFQRKVFRDEALPLYAILEPLPDGKVRVVGVYDEGKINDPARFAEFLKKSLGK
jgi:thiol:disulfide interchange protein DsbD